jgi:hypothetical protein
MRSIIYRGGVIRFEVPDDWIEGVEPDGGSAYYPSNSESPTLFIHVMTCKSPHTHVEAEALVTLLSSRSEQSGQSIVTFENGNPALIYSRRFAERGKAGVLHRWEVARAAPPHHIRLAIFTLALIDGQPAEAEAGELVQMVDRIARNCTFASEIGNLIE